jgi:hypothetical protein
MNYKSEYIITMFNSYTKYFYILIMFVVAFVAMSNYLTASIGFGLVFAVQLIYTLVFLFELANDTSRQNKSLALTFPKTAITSGNDIMLPLYWALCPGIILQFVASLLTVMSTDFLYKKYNSLKLSRSARFNLTMYKWMFVIATIALIGLTYSYSNDFTSAISSVNFSGGYKSLLLVLFLSSIILPVINVINANKLSKIMVSSTDG